MWPHTESVAQIAAVTMTCLIRLNHPWPSLGLGLSWMPSRSPPLVTLIAIPAMA